MSGRRNSHMELRPSQRQTRARIRATCRDCKACRQRKVKCDGQRPTCGTCALRNQVCEYPRDGRRTVTRAKREDITSLQRQIEELKGQMHRRTSSDVAGTDSIDAHDDSRSKCPSCAQDETNLLPLDRFPSCSPQRTESLRSGSQGPTTTERPGSEKRPCSTHDSLEHRGIQVCGATSMLHSHLEPAPARYQWSENGNDLTRDRLIDFSATMRQKETMIYSAPSMVANVDFDGVHIDTAMHLFELHWNRLHLLYLLTYRPAIMDSLFNNGPYMNKLLLNAIYLQSSLYSDRISLCSDPEDSRMVFYHRFKSLLIHYVDKPSLPTVVALLTCGACLLQYGQQSASWAFCGMAYRMITDLGYHLDDPSSSRTDEELQLSPLDKEMRRRVYWGAYATDKAQSLYLGRPPGLRQFDSNAPIEFFDTYEELEEWKPYIDPQAQPYGSKVPVYRSRPSYAISTFECLLQLSIITEIIINVFYATGSAKSPGHTLLQSRQTVKARLNHWRESLPYHLRFDPNADEIPPPHQMTLHTTYSTLVILSEQPFLARGHFSFTIDPRLQSEARGGCMEAAFKIRHLIEAYKKAFTLRRAQYGISYAMYSAILVLLQHADQDDIEYLEAIRFFWSALREYQSGCGRGLTGPLRLLKSLIRRVEKVVQRIDIGHPGTTGCPASSDMQFGAEPIAGTEALAGNENQGGSWLNAETDDLFFADDTIFGFFTQE
ncbi:fungal-specific transcription factor domain-containing protein [Aspergillus floccosus]